MSSDYIKFFSGILSFIRNSDILTNIPQNGRNITVQTTLKKVWNMAICVAAELNHLPNVISIKSDLSISKIKNITEPKTLNNKCIRLARLAFVPAVMEDISAVTHEPIFVPSIMYSTSFPPVPTVKPATDIAIIIEVVAELDCTNAVRKIPIIKSKNGFLTFANNACIASLLTFIASDIMERPINTSPSPDMIKPVFLDFRFYTAYLLLFQQIRKPEYRSLSGMRLMRLFVL